MPRRWLAWLVFSVFLGNYGTSDLGAQGGAVQLEGQAYLPLPLVATRIGMNSYWLEGYQTFRLRSQWTNADFPRAGRTIRINGVRVDLGFSTRLHKEVLHISVHDYGKVLRAILTPQVFNQPFRVRRIVIDPGHGGKDPGAVVARPALQEKDIALKTSLYLAEQLRAAGFEVVLVRDRDVFIPLLERARIANRHRADLFISVHFNAAANANARGIEVFSLTPAGQPPSGRSGLTAVDRAVHPGNALDARNRLAAYHIQRALITVSGEVDRGVKTGRFAVLRPLECPGVLVELGFMTHAGTASKLRSDAYLRGLATALARGVIQYRDHLGRFID